MAEATVDVVIVNLSSLIGHELRQFLGFDQDLERLLSMLTAIRATLADAEERQFSDRSIKYWLQKLQDVALILDDVIDECFYEALGFKYQGFMCSPSDQVQHSCLSSFHQKHVFGYKIAKKMKRISQRLDQIAQERLKFPLSETVPLRTRVIEWRQTTSFITEPQVYGREEDKHKILNFLIADAHVSHLEDLFVYPIVGMGGLGKTTLARLIFNHGMIVRHFELRIWVCVSEDFSVKRLTKVIIEEITGHACEDLNLEELQRRCRDLLQGKTYLLVLDDVWDLDRVHWLELKYLLACGAKSSSVLITTRHRRVAAIMGTVPPHELSGLSDNHCWELFRHRAFGPNEVQQEELMVIGREIVKKCGGVPLAAKSLGDFLRFKREGSEWFIVKESNILELSDIRNSIMSSMSLSYQKLPMKLRQCFVYCAIFPKGEIIEKQHLIELWMANGFISSTGISDAEDVGDGVWNELYQRSFFQDIETDKFGNVTVFKMHDLLHDLAQSIAEDVSCVTDDISVTSLPPERIHHLSYHRNSTQRAISIQLQNKESLRTCILPNGHTTTQFFPHVLKCYSLRVLHCQPIEELSSSIGDLKHLRYLNLSGAVFKILPESLCKLWNLQTLKLDGCQFLQKLPNNLIHLKALRHLYLNYCFLLSNLPPQIGKLTSLRILSTYFVGKEKGFLLAELGALKLKGDLLIKHLEKVKSVGDAKEANMSIKQLNKLSLSWDNNEESELQENVEEILEALQPNTQQLESLIVDGYRGAHFPQWMHGSSLQYLTHLELLNCESCLRLPALGKLPSLRKLNIYRAIHVKYIDEECYGGGAFTALEYLKLEKLPNLIRLLKENGENKFPCLSTLEVKGCPKFFAEEVLLEALHSLKKLDIVGCVKFNMLADFQYLTCLEHLAISSCIVVEGLHEALQHMTALQELLLCDLPNLPSLPKCFENLPLLHKLHIVDCDMLSCFPTSLGSLERLTIRGCPELEKRCQKEIGEDWPKIAHIPHIRVGGDDSDSN